MTEKEVPPVLICMSLPLALLRIATCETDSFSNFSVKPFYVLPIDIVTAEILYAFRILKILLLTKLLHSSFAISYRSEDIQRQTNFINNLKLLIWGCVLDNH